MTYSHNTTSAAGASPEQKELQRREQSAPRPDIEGIAPRAGAALAHGAYLTSVTRNEAFAVCSYTRALEATLRQILDDPNDLPPVERLARIHRVAEQALGDDRC